jgi:L-threonylcarbamoyladenylate synthase
VIPGIVTAGGATVGVRWPSHPFIQAVIRACGFPLAAPSANPSNQISPTTAEHVQSGLKIPLVVDGGPSNIGIESTVLDLVSPTPRLLRPGMVHSEALLAVLGKIGLQTEVSSDKILRSPGMLKKHYSPKAKLLILSWQNEADLRDQLRPTGIAPARTHLLAYNHLPTSTDWGRTSVLPHDASAFARMIYAELHTCDAKGAELIVVEAPPRDELWRGVGDRLARAAVSH